VICDNHETAMNTKKISSVEAPEYRLFLDNYNKLRKTVGNMKSRK